MTMFMVRDGTYICAIPEGQSTDTKLPAIVSLKSKGRSEEQNTDQYMSPAILSL